MKDLYQTQPFNKYGFTVDAHGSWKCDLQYYSFLSRTLSISTLVKDDQVAFEKRLFKDHLVIFYH